MSLISVAAKFDPFAPAPDKVFAVPAGLTVAELVRRCDPPAWFETVGHVAIRTALGVAEILPQYWGRTRPKAGTALAVYVLPRGGGGGGQGGRKNVLATVASIAVLAAATAVSGGLLGPAAAGGIGTGLFGSSFAAGGLGATLAGAAVGIVGSLAIAALAPPALAPNLQNASGNADLEARSIAGVNGNALNRGAQVPMVAGTMVASPPLLARPYTSFQNGDTFAHAIVGLWGRHQITDIKVNGTDVALVPDIEIEVREGLLSDDRITVAPNTVIEDRTVGQLSEFKLDRTVPTQVRDTANVPANLPIWHYATTDGVADQIRIRIQFPSGMVRNNQSTGNQERISVPLRLAMRRIGDTDWINLPEIHYSDSDATVRAFTQQITVDWDSRTPNQRATLKADFLTYRAYATTGVNSYDWQAHPFFQSSPTEFTPENSSITEDGITFYLSDAPFPRGEYEIRMMRGLGYVGIETGATAHEGRLFEADGTSVLVSQRDMASAMICETVQTFRQAYPLSRRQPFALIAVKGRGLQLESISARFTSYAPVWTGSAWTTAESPTANPAAIYRRMLLDYDAVTGKLPASMRDDAALGAWFEHCADKGHQVNAVLTDGTLKSNLQLVAAAGWALPSYGQKWSVIIERDRSALTPVQMITPLTGRGLRWEKQFEELPHAIAAEFVDAARSYKLRDDVFVYRSGFSAANARDTQTINYQGITSEAAVRARARLDLGQLLYRRTTYKLDIFIEHLMARRGDLVLLAHDTLGARYGFGRIAGVTAAAGLITAVTLNTPISIPPGPGDLFQMGDLFQGGALVPLFQDDAFDQDVFGDVWTGRDLFAPTGAAAVAIRHSTGNAITYPIADLTGSNVLTFETPIPDAGTIVPGCVAVIGARGMATRRCLVFDVTRNDLDTATITLIDEAPQLHS